jgi:hypothetical protein
MTTDTLAIRAAIQGILDELDLQAFVFTYEAKDGHPAVHVECATNGVWQTVSLPADPHALLASANDAKVRERVREAWRQRLGACTKARIT